MSTPPAYTTILTLSGLTAHDIIDLTPKSWRVHQEYMALRDTMAQIIVMIQSNIIAGTIATHATARPDLHPLLEDILNYNVICVW